MTYLFEHFPAAAAVEVAAAAAVAVDALEGLASGRKGLRDGWAGLELAAPASCDEWKIAFKNLISSRA